jgi:hypothetical protein
VERGKGNESAVHLDAAGVLGKVRDGRTTANRSTAAASGAQEDELIRSIYGFEGQSLGADHANGAARPMRSMARLGQPSSVISLKRHR